MDTNMTNSESIAFNEDLNRHMAKETASDNRAEWIANKATELFATDYSPFQPENIQEAISELSFADSNLFGVYLSACAVNPNNYISTTSLADFLVDRISDYWIDASRRRAAILFDERGV